jgi:hypothetical protein
MNNNLILSTYILQIFISVTHLCILFIDLIVFILDLLLSNLEISALVMVISFQANLLLYNFYKFASLVL